MSSAITIAFANYTGKSAVSFSSGKLISHLQIEISLSVTVDKLLFAIMFQMLLLYIVKLYSNYSYNYLAV